MMVFNRNRSQVFTSKFVVLVRCRCLQDLLGLYLIYNHESTFADSAEYDVNRHMHCLDRQKLLIYFYSGKVFIEYEATLKTDKRSHLRWNPIFQKPKYKGITEGGDVFEAVDVAYLSYKLTRSSESGFPLFENFCHIELEIMIHLCMYLLSSETGCMTYFSGKK